MKREAAWRGLRGVLAWAPVWMPLILFAQIGLRGLRPALDESRHLDRAEADLTARHERVVERQHELQRMLRAQADPMWQERQRRLLLAPDAPAPLGD